MTSARLPKLLALLLIGAFFMSAVLGGALFQPASFASDVSAYLKAAHQLTTGQLYAHTDGDASSVYRYAPWFAAMWIPFVSLPHAVVAVVWITVLVMTSLWLLWPLRRSISGLALACLIGPFLFDYSWRGNVEALMLALVALHRSRGGPILLGIAASLKVMPILLVIDYLADRRYRDVAIGLLTTAVLWMPAVIVANIGAYPTSPTTMSLWHFGPQLGVIVLTGGTLIACWLAARQSRWTLLAAVTTAVVGSPRLLMLNVGYFAVPARRPEVGDGRSVAAELAPASRD